MSAEETRLEVRVVPSAPHSQVMPRASGQGMWRIKIAAPPVAGKANTELIAFLSQVLDIPRRQVSLLRGHTSRSKALSIAGLSPEAVAARLEEAASRQSTRTEYRPDTGPRHSRETPQGGESARRTRQRWPVMANPEPEVDLHRLTVEEAISRLDRFLYDTYVAGLTWVRVVHGKGTGTLRQAVRQELGQHPLVRSFHTGLPTEGGDGVTVVQLTDR